MLRNGYLAPCSDSRELVHAANLDALLHAAKLLQGLTHGANSYSVRDGQVGDRVDVERKTCLASVVSSLLDSNYPTLVGN